MSPFSRQTPSPRYQALQALYARMHEEGEQHLGLRADQTFPGASLVRHVEPIKRLVQETGAQTILDYGSGKGQQYRPMPIEVDGRHAADSIAEYWDVDEVRCYDPGYAPYRDLPAGTFDGVVCTDVLEHCPEDDLPWILAEIFSYARRFVFLNVACFPARKHLPDGTNAHITVRSPEWWKTVVAESASRHMNTLWELRASVQDKDRVRESVFRKGAAPAAEAGSDEADILSASLDGQPARFWIPGGATRWRVESLYIKEPVTIEWLRSIPENGVLFDVGANVGIYTLFAAVARHATVFAFEPESQNYAVLNRNIALNRLDSRVTAYCAALSDESAISRLYLSSQHAGGSCHSLGEEVGFDLKPRPASYQQGCLSLRLDDAIRIGQLPSPEFVKIDVDGFEHKVLQGMTGVLGSASLRSLIVELNPHIPEHLRARAWLGEFGFRWDEAQVKRAARTSGTFTGVAEHVFVR